MDPLEHLDHLDVGPAVQRSPQGADARRAGGEQVGLATSPTVRTVDVLQFCSWSACRMKIRFSASSISGVHHVLLVGHREHHVQEVGAVAQVRDRDR